MVFGEPGGARSDGGTWHERGELGAGGRGAIWGLGALAGRGERPRIEADRADNACEVSRLDARALRRAGCAYEAGKKISGQGRLALPN
jgi:hypothetical protein